jgi:hypothetical protein
MEADMIQEVEDISSVYRNEYGNPTLLVAMWAK